MILAHLCSSWVNDLDYLFPFQKGKMGEAHLPNK